MSLEDPLREISIRIDHQWCADWISETNGILSSQLVGGESFTNILQDLGLLSHAGHESEVWSFQDLFEAIKSPLTELLRTSGQIGYEGSRK